MSTQLAGEIRVELDYGMVYMLKSLSETPERKMAVNKIREARMAMSRYGVYSGGGNPYPNAIIPENNVIEFDLDKVDKEIVVVNENYTEVQHLKFLAKGLTLGFEKIVGIRTSRMMIKDPSWMYLAMKALDRAIDCMEEAILYLVEDLQRISVMEPGKYPVVLQASSEREEKVAPEEARTTDDIMSDRASDTDLPGKQFEDSSSSTSSEDSSQTTKE